MKRHATFLYALVGCSAPLTGCGAHEAPLTGGAAPPASQPVAAPAPPRVAAPSPERDSIAKMYDGYRAEAFAGAKDIEIADLDAVSTAAPAGPALLVDCREDAERAVSMIDGAITKTEFEANPDRYRDRVIVPYCTIGYRSGVYTAKLMERGFDARNLVGGVLAWAHEGRPFIDEQGRSTQRVHVYGATWDLLPATHESIYEGKPTP